MRKLNQGKWLPMRSIDFGCCTRHCEEQSDEAMHASSFGEGPKGQTSDAQLRIGESRDSGLDAEPVIGPRFARTRWHRPGMTESGLLLAELIIGPVRGGTRWLLASRSMRLILC